MGMGMGSKHVQELPVTSYLHTTSVLTYVEPPGLYRWPPSQNTLRVWGGKGFGGHTEGGLGRESSDKPTPHTSPNPQQRVPWTTPSKSQVVAPAVHNSHVTRCHAKGHGGKGAPRLGSGIKRLDGVHIEGTVAF